MNIATFRNHPPRWATAIGVVVALLGCGGGGGGSPTGDLICSGEGVVVGGRVTFVKRLYNGNPQRGPVGLTGARQTMPVRYGKVEVVLAIDGRIVGETYTDANGNYCAGVTGVPPDFPTVYPRVASLTDPDRFKIVVMSDASYLFSLPVASLNGTQPGIYKRDIPIPVTVRVEGGVDHPISGAFNIMDVLTTGAEQAVALTGRPHSGTLYGVWRPGTYFGSGTEGTYFVGLDATTIGQDGDGYIVLSGGAGGGPDTGNHDEFDDDVILHEFGHFMAYVYSSPAEVGGPHYLNDHTQDSRLAWSEGWATFWSAAVRKNRSMVNTFGGDPGTEGHDLSYEFEIETPSSKVLTAIGTPLDRHGIYTTSEVAVASVLWDIYDGVSDDNVSAGLEAVWNVMDAFTTAVPRPSSINLETFGLFFGFSKLRDVAKLRFIEFSLDSYEVSDNSLGTAPTYPSGVVSPCHTLFPEGDVDHVKLVMDVARTVTVETYNLTNGADTVLEILGSNGAVLTRNDDAELKPPYRSDVTERCNQADPVRLEYMDGPNNGQRFASRIVFTAQPGTYYVKVASGGRPEAGRLGGYGLSIVTQ